MHIHILGICGTFMGGVAALARAAGHQVTGSDENVYPPMSTQLAGLGIDIMQGYSAAHLDSAPDYVVVGNAMSRGNPAVEAMLDRRIAYCSGPQWLAQHVLHDRHVLAVSGTHGKTTTSCMLAWILEDAGLAPGFLIGGIGSNFEVSARFGDSEYFVVEADEYDTAFFDKRAKFVHYSPQTLVINNLEFDHADIYADIDAIYWQFHQLMRTLASNGRIIANADDDNIATMLEQGCWTPVEFFSLGNGCEWSGNFADTGERRIRILERGGEAVESPWQLGGSHNLENALAAVAAARSAGVSLPQAVDALSRFSGVRRRMERTATVSDIAIYDDFAHHPTAIRRSIEGLKKRFPGQRIVIALEPRSNTMKMGVHKASLAEALDDADLVFVYRPDELSAVFDASLKSLGKRLHVVNDYGLLLDKLEDRLLAGDQLVFMSNGGFGGTRQKLTAALRKKQQ
ncbi:MAG: UDP-N-acetylmuramate:L-alanyl-gamma-D-glutamyl-meso-diaminopimelate ligase [Woeseiaceae bacterium]|nr:UDP-N-acetylmuramate:L-alanyl-gamma-D-glutamyl-meso-diaminopimelate ligase [Woeseiaceae bacterium]